MNVALRKESVDRNPVVPAELTTLVKSLSARRAWIEIRGINCKAAETAVALRKESVDRNLDTMQIIVVVVVALRKESVDRNMPGENLVNGVCLSLSARRAWIEMM